MRRYTTASLAWVAWLAIAATALTILSGPPSAATSAEWLALTLFALGGATTHMFPVRSALGGATYTLTNVFLITGAVVLPAPLLTPLAILALTPERWRRRGRPGLLIGWVFNVGQSALALHAAGAVARAFGVRAEGTPIELLALLAAAIVFTVAQDVMVGVMIALQSRTSIFSSDVFRLPALLSDSLLAVLGVIVAGLWLHTPFLLGLLPPLLIIVFRMTRTAHLAHLAELDVKTGLHNYRHFERVLEEELARSARVGRPLAVLFADLDHFKQVNDRYGHTVGDEVLQQTSTLMKSVLRKTDLVARFGGEEFVALLPGTDAEQAIYLAERIRQVVESHVFTAGTEGISLHCSISVGVAAAPDDGTDSITLMKQADVAMYRAKRTRNAVARPSAAVARLSTEVVEPAVVQSGTTLPLHGHLVLWSCVVGGLVAALASGVQVFQAGALLDLWPFILLVIGAEFLGVRIYETGRDRISFSFAGASAMLAVTAMPLGAPLVVFTASVVHNLQAKRRDPSRMLFNLANPSLAIGGAVAAYLLLRPAGQGFSPMHLVAALGAAVVFYAFNSGPVALLVSLSSRRPLGTVLRESGWSAPINIFLGLTGAFLGGAHEILGVIGTLIYVVPVLIMRLTLDFYAKRSQKAIATLQALNGQLEAEISQRQRFEETLEHQALHDPLTDFPNRSFLLARMGELVEETKDAAPRLALLLLDLDRFKEINDTFGHQTGDSLLQEVGQRLRDRLRAGDTIARLGGDEFGVLLPDADAQAAVRAARTILEALQQPLVLEGQELEVGASIGIALSPEHGSDPDALLRRADVAMYVAKRGHTRLAVYDPEQDHHSPARLQLVGELRRAIGTDGLILHYQPKVSFRTGKVVGSEALVRWNHPQRGTVPPDEFIALAENTGLIRPLSRWVLNDALRQQRAWQDADLFLPVSVNLSTRDLLDSQLPELVATLLARWNIAPSSLKLEITESAVMADAERAIDVLGQLRAMGVRIAVDDFGTGYSSLSYLKRLPVDELKIDRSFVEHIASDENDVAIVRSTVSLAHDLGLTVVAEGIEDRASWDVLARLGCDIVQGYYVSKPLAADALVEWLRQQPSVEEREAA